MEAGFVLLFMGIIGVGIGVAESVGIAMVGAGARVGGSAACPQAVEINRHAASRYVNRYFLEMLMVQELRRPASWGCAWGSAWGDESGLE